MKQLLDRRKGHLSVSMRLVLVMLLAAMSACDTHKSVQTAGTSAPAEVAPAPTKPPESGAPAMSNLVLTLSEFQLTDGFARPMTMSAEGAVRLPLGVWGHVAANGIVTNAKRTERGRLRPDGGVIDAAGELIATIDADATAHINGRELRFDENGRLVSGEAAPAITLSPPDTPARRTAMLVVILSIARPAPEDAKLVPKVRIQPGIQAN